MKGERCFVDTNVVLCTVDHDEPDKRSRAIELVSDLIARQTAVVSYQVIQEFLNACTRKFARKVDDQDALRYAERVLWPLCRVLPSAGLLETGMRLHGRYGFGFHDGLIVAAALDAGCRTLYSEDLHDGLKVDRLTIVNPFAGT